ncbi:MAG: isoprenyl transferase [Sphingobacteriales bacterium JAD_PAG50586_3]|nr:MAG: isoprenyl transferase [Sphingobacteriales bacterium JAD_PAG50586_3]
MDGNGRWAKQRGMMRVLGHKNAIKAVRDTVEAAAELGVKHLTMYAFSTENWNRPKMEVDALMDLLVSTIQGEVKTLNQNKIKLNAIGDIDSLPVKTRKELLKAIDDTAGNNHMTLHLALSYSGRSEIMRAIKNMMFDLESNKIERSALNDDLFAQYLYTAGIPDPELLIRTSGEHRISNFLLWQMAYTEFYFTEKLWPDFRKADFFDAVLDYQSRERRFGKTSEQVDKKTKP